MINLGGNVAVFVLFFGIALLDALRSGNFVAALLWMALGLLFVRADTVKRKH